MGGSAAPGGVEDPSGRVDHALGRGRSHRAATEWKIVISLRSPGPSTSRVTRAAAMLPAVSSMYMTMIW
jgi:hypothetical protein